MTGKSATADAFPLLIVTPNILLMAGFREVFDIIIRWFSRQRDRHALVVVTGSGVVVVGLVWSVRVGAHRAPPCTRKPTQRLSESRALVGSMGTRGHSGHTPAGSPAPLPRWA